MRRLAILALPLALAGCGTGEKPVRTRHFGYVKVAEYADRVEITQPSSGVLSKGGIEKCMDTFVDNPPYKSLDSIKWNCKITGEGETQNPGKAVRERFSGLVSYLESEGYKFPEAKGE